MQYRKDIQGLRALAIIFVFIFHLNPNWLPGGFIGVDVFFVISGFLVSSIIFKKLDTGTFNFTDFYTARVRRIVPAYYLMLLCVAIGMSVLLIGYEADTYKRTLKHAMIFNADYGFATTNSYFGIDLRQNPLLHAWTLATEMKFYLLLPLVLVFVKRSYLKYVLGAIFVVLTCYGIYQIQYAHNRSVAYYSLPIRIPEFLMGVFLALWSTKPRRAAPALKTAAGIAGIIIVVLCAVFFSHKTKFPGVMALLPCVGAVLLLFSGTGPVHRLLSVKPLVAAGALSYSIYLWHWPVMALVRYYYETEIFSNAQLLMVVVLTALFSIISYFAAEQYFRAKKLRPLVVAIPAMLCLIIIVYTYAVPINTYFSSIPADYSRPLFGARSHNTKFVETLGDTTRKPEIYLTGNSHALSLKGYFDYIGKRQHFSFRTLTSNTFLPIEGLDAKQAMRARAGDFTDAQKLLPTAKKELANAKIIIIVSSTWSYAGSFKPAIEKLILNLKPGQHLILVGTFPTLDKSPLKVNRSMVKNHDIAQTYKVKFKTADAEILGFAKRYANVHYFDLSTGKTYKDVPFYNDTVMYYDRKHLNKFGATALARDTEAEFMQLLDSLR